MGYGHRLGLISEAVYSRLQTKEELIGAGVRFVRNTSVAPAEINPYLEQHEGEPLKEREKISQILKRSGTSLFEILRLPSVMGQEFVGTLEKTPEAGLAKEAVRQIEIEVKYEGYILRQKEQVERFEKYESQEIPQDLDFGRIMALSSEGKEKLARIRPVSIGQASRISGVTPSDVSVLLVYLKG